MGESNRAFESSSLTPWSDFVLIEFSVVGFPGSRRRALTGSAGFPSSLDEKPSLKAQIPQGPGRVPPRPGRLRRRLNSSIADSKLARENSGHSSSRKISSERATCQSM